MSTSKKTLVPTVLLSTVLLGSGIAWWVTRSSEAGQNEHSPTDAKERVREAQEQVDTEEVKNRLQRSWALVKTTIAQLQTIYDRYGPDLLQQIQTMKQESQDVVDTAKEAGKEVQEVADQQGKEAVQEAQQAKEEAEQGLSKDDNASSDEHDPRGPFDSR